MPALFTSTSGHVAEVIEHSLDIRFTARIGAIADRIAHAARCGLDSLLIDIDEADAIARLTGAQGNLLAEPAAGPSDNHRFHRVNTTG